MTLKAIYVGLSETKMFKVFIEMPSGATSKPHVFDEEEDAQKLFDRFLDQMKPWKKFQATVIMQSNGKTTTVEIDNA
jgi:hypothetical protein